MHYCIVWKLCRFTCLVWILHTFTCTPLFRESNISSRWITKKLATLIFLISRVLLRPVTSSSGIPVHLELGHMTRKVRTTSFIKWWSDLIPTFVPENLGNLLPPQNLALWTKRRPLRNHFSSKFCYIWWYNIFVNRFFLLFDQLMYLLLMNFVSN